MYITTCNEWQLVTSCFCASWYLVTNWHLLITELQAFSHSICLNCKSVETVIIYQMQKWYCSIYYLPFLFATAAESLGIPYLSAYLNSIGSNFTQGANFATAGSSIRRQNTSLFLSGFSPISLDVQSWEFEQFINRSEYVYNSKGTISISIIFFLV
jgi:hypothetical protein